MESLWLKKIKRITKLDPFYMSVVNKMEIEISFKIPTAAIVNNKILLNPYFVSKLSNEHVNDMMQHEINHILYNKGLL